MMMSETNGMFPKKERERKEEEDMVPNDEQWHSVLFLRRFVY